jgi:hypothetical protein
MEWLILLLVFGASAFFFARHYVGRVDRIEREKAEREANNR